MAGEAEAKPNKGRPDQGRPFASAALSPVTQVSPPVAGRRGPLPFAGLRRALLPTATLRMKHTRAAYLRVGPPSCAFPSGNPRAFLYDGAGRTRRGQAGEW